MNKAKENYNGGLNLPTIKTREISSAELESEVIYRGENMGLSNVKKVIDPIDQCQAITRKGQCKRHREPGSLNCEIHRGLADAMKIVTKQTNNYRLNSVNIAGKDDLGLREEIALNRVLTEEMWNSSASKAELVLNAPALTAMLLATEKLVSSCHKVEHGLNKHLTEEQALAFTEDILRVIADNIIDKDILNAIGIGIREINEKYF